MTLHLRQIPVGTRFYLVRTMQAYKLLSAGPSAAGGYKYKCFREGATHWMFLHHSCHVKPIVRSI